MREPQFCIHWNSYMNHVSNGFSSLQQNAEFVDMTLAAEGHLVKVHQNIVALASPYLKAMLQSASCRHPVVFLNNITHETLGYILEYIYTGEVKIPTNSVEKFIAACKALFIKGITDIDEKNITAKDPDPPVKRPEKPPDNFAAHITINTNDNDINVELVSNNNNTNDNDEEVTVMNDAPAITVDNEDMEAETDDRQIADNNTGCKASLDISSIKDFVILKPKNPCTAPDVNTDKAANPITIISDVTINTRSDLTTALTGWQTNLCNTQESNMNRTENPINISLDTTLTENADNTTLGSNLIGNPVNIPLNTNSTGEPVQIKVGNNQWFSQGNQNTSNIEIKTDIPVNTLNTQNCLTIPIETNSDVAIKNQPINITLTAEDWQYGPSQSISHNESNDKPTYGNICTEPISRLNLTLDKKRVFRNIKKIGSFVRKTQEKPVKLTQHKAPILSSKAPMDNIPHYTISNRGALQLILNHYMYCSHHNSSGGRKQRWRCIEYRKTHCAAFVDTDDEDIIAVSSEHDHPSHDNRIRKKIKESLVFTSLTNAIDTITNTLHKEEEEEEKVKPRKRSRIITAE